MSMTLVYGRLCRASVALSCAVTCGIGAIGAPVLEAAETVPEQAAVDTGPTHAAPPFLVSGVALSPGFRMAQVVALAADGAPVESFSVREGSRIGDYTVTKIRPKLVYLEKGGQLYSVAVGNPQPELAPVVEQTASGARPEEHTAQADGSASESGSDPWVEVGTVGAGANGRSTASANGPDEEPPGPHQDLPSLEDNSSLTPDQVTAIRAETDSFLQQLKGNPNFQSQVEVARQHLMSNPPQQEATPALPTPPTDMQ
jgi:hypothetical protein